MIENLLSQIVNTETSYEAWQKLNTAYVPGSKAQVRSLKPQLSSLKQGSFSISTNLQRAKNLADQFVALQSPILDDDLCHAIQVGFGKPYVPFVRALDVRNNDLTFDDLYGLLLSRELQIKKFVTSKTLSV